MKRRHRRLAFALAAIGLAGSAVGLALWALQDTVTYFYSPAQLVTMRAKPEGRIRVGGLVAAGSLHRLTATAIRFQLTDRDSVINVTFDGALPDLFREGQGVIAEGELGPDGVFRAASVLAKHDETYMPGEIVRTLKEQKHWRATQPPTR